MAIQKQTIIAIMILCSISCSIFHTSQEGGSYSTTEVTEPGQPTTPVKFEKEGVLYKGTGTASYKLRLDNMEEVYLQIETSLNANEIAPWLGCKRVKVQGFETRPGSDIILTITKVSLVNE